MAFSKEFACKTPSTDTKLLCRETTILVRLGKALPMDSKVFRPIMTECPVVSNLNCFKSAESFQSNWLSFPITPSNAVATIIEIISITPPQPSPIGRGLFLLALPSRGGLGGVAIYKFFALQLPKIALFHFIFFKSKYFSQLGVNMALWLHSNSKH